MAYDNKFKTKTIEYRKKGNSVRKTAETFGILTNTLNAWLKEYDEHGEFNIKPKPANNTKLTEEALLEYILQRMKIAIKKKPQNTSGLALGYREP